MPEKLIRRTSGLILSAVATLLLLPAAYAQVLASSVSTETGINKAALSSQKRVTRLAQQTTDLLAEYRAVVRETESLKIYNDNLEKVVMDQRQEVVSINQQLNGLEATNRGIVPLMLEMIDTLGKIIENDMPFRLEERRARVERLHDMMDQADVTASEKYRRVMEAYQGEMEFGRTTEAYAETLPTTGQTVGMRAWKVRVVSSGGSIISWPRCLLRYVVGLVSLVVFGLGILWALVDKQNRGWHDLAAHTLLIKPSGAKPPRQQSSE